MFDPVAHSLPRCHELIVTRSASAPGYGGCVLSPRGEVSANQATVLPLHRDELRQRGLHAQPARVGRENATDNRLDKVLKRFAAQTPRVANDSRLSSSPLRRALTKYSDNMRSLPAILSVPVVRMGQTRVGCTRLNQTVSARCVRG